MKLGSLDLVRREIDDFSAASLLRAYQEAEEPGKSFVRLAALGICTRADHGSEATAGSKMPAYRGGSYEAYGQQVRRWLEAMSLPMGRALTIGLMAVSAISQARGVTDKEVEEAAAFFEIVLTGSAGSDSPTDTAAGTSSAG
jgi:hypothetical protein